MVYNRWTEKVTWRWVPHLKKATSGTLLTLLTSPGQRYKHQAFIQALLSSAVSPKDTVSLLFA